MTGERPAVARQAPVVIVGSGAAGLACGLALAPTPVVLLTKTADLAGGSSLLSQGGIAAAIGPMDSLDQHVLDTLRTGAGLADPERVASMVGEGPDAVRWLLAAGFPADREAGGGLKLGREGAHSQARIIHAGGDATGQSLIATLANQVSRTPSIEVLTATLAVDLLVERGRIVGLLAYRQGHGWLVLATPAVVLATGGTGALWRETTNPTEATGDGLALAARVGALFADLEFVQFHPTALLPKSAVEGARLPLLTEALRGAGARLLDQTGRAFMSDEHLLGDLAPRDSVARAIWRRRSAGEAVFLDLRPALETQGEEAFPLAVTQCRDSGFEPTSSPVPVTPAAHYHMGGVLTDGLGRSSVPGLWVCGEAASTGVHGANRLASNSLLEALSWARRVADVLRRAPASSCRVLPQAPASPAVFRRAADNSLERIGDRLRVVMSRYVGIVRHGPGLSEAAGALESLSKEVESQASQGRAGASTDFQSVRTWSDVRNMVLVGRLITLAALKRAESRGAHFRSDCPRTQENWAYRQVLTLTDLEVARPAAPEPLSHRDGGAQHGALCTASCSQTPG